MYTVSLEQAQALVMKPISDDPSEDWVECECGGSAAFFGPAADIPIDELICDECFNDLLDELNGGKDWCFRGDDLNHEQYERESAKLRVAIMSHLSPAL